MSLTLHGTGIPRPLCYPNPLEKSLPGDTGELERQILPDNILSCPCGPDIWDVLEIPIKLTCFLANIVSLLPHKSL